MRCRNGWISILAAPGFQAGAEPMAWFYRVVEQDDHTWVCRHGRWIYDAHNNLDEALDHIVALAGQHRPAEVFVHRTDGGIDSLSLL